MVPQRGGERAGEDPRLPVGFDGRDVVREDLCNLRRGRASGSDNTGWGPALQCESAVCSTATTIQCGWLSGEKMQLGWRR